MNFKAILKIVSPVVAVMGVAMILCAVVSLIYHESPEPLLAGGSLALLFGSVFYRKFKDVETSDMTILEGCAVATLSWLLSCLFGALPFYQLNLFQPEHHFTFIESLFESVSGFTTTGASVIANVEILPKGILFWRSLTHWFGGMGIVVLAIAILPKLGIGGMQAFRMESPGPLKTDKLVPRIGQTGKILYTVYLAITIFEFIALLLVKVGPFDALIHTFGTVGTGGFSNYNNSVAGLNNIYAEYIIAFFMWLSGVNFALTYLVIFKRQLNVWWKDVEFRVYTWLTVVAILVISLSLYLNNYQAWSLGKIVRYAVFQVPTVMTTTGYATYDYSLWPATALGVLVLLLFVGGSTGSTGGGLKVLRHVINFKAMKYELIKIFRPNLVATIKIGDRPLNNSIVNSVMALTLIYLFIFVACGLLLTFFGVDLVTAFSSSIACLGNIGPGLGVVGPAGNYSSLPPVVLLILSFEMLLGRLEVYTIIVLFSAIRHKKWV